MHLRTSAGIASSKTLLDLLLAPTSLFYILRDYLVLKRFYFQKALEPPTLQEVLHILSSMSKRIEGGPCFVMIRYNR